MALIFSILRIMSLNRLNYRKREMHIEREALHLLVHSQDDNRGQGWARQRLGTSPRFAR